MFLPFGFLAFLSILIYLYKLNFENNCFWCIVSFVLICLHSLCPFEYYFHLNAQVFLKNCIQLLFTIFSCFIWSLLDVISSKIVSSRSVFEVNQLICNKNWIQLLVMYFLCKTLCFLNFLPSVLHCLLKRFLCALYFVDFLFELSNLLF